LHIARRQKSRSSAEQPAKQIKELLQAEPGILIINFTGTDSQSLTLQKYELQPAEFAHSTQAKEHEQRKAAGGADKRAAAGGAGNINYQFYRHRFAEPDFAKI